MCKHYRIEKKRKTLQIDIAFSSSYEALVMLKSSIFYKTGCKAKLLYLFHTRTNYELWAGGGGGGGRNEGFGESGNTTQ